MPPMLELALLLLESFILNDGFLNLTLLRRINFDFPVLPVTLPGLCGAIDTKNEHSKFKGKTISFHCFTSSFSISSNRISINNNNSIIIIHYQCGMITFIGIIFFIYRKTNMSFTR